MRKSTVNSKIEKKWWISFENVHGDVAVNTEKHILKYGLSSMNTTCKSIFNNIWEHRYEKHSTVEDHDIAMFMYYEEKYGEYKT